LISFREKLSKREQKEPGELDALWRSFVRNRDSHTREILIETYCEFARMLTAKLYANRHVRELEFEDFFQFALVGLMEAVDRFDPVFGVNFQSFASARIKGAVLSGVEKLCERQQQISLQSRLKNERLVSLIEVAEGANTSSSLFQQLAETTIGLAIGFFLGESGMYRAHEQQTDCSGYQRLELKKLCEIMAGLVDKLPVQQAHVIKGHYFHDHAFVDIGRNLGISKGRVSQIHKTALMELRLLYEKDTQLDKLL
jgi:RNA polymerase sigma factor for flagellar operon FliA